MSPVRPHTPAATVCVFSAPLAAPADMSGDHLHNDSQVRPCQARPGPLPCLGPPRLPPQRPRPRPGCFDRPEPLARGGQPADLGSPGPRRKPPTYSLGVLAVPSGRSRGPPSSRGAQGGPGSRPRALARCRRGECACCFMVPLLFSPQIEADFRLNGECAPLPDPRLRGRRPRARPEPGRGQTWRPRD